eukprot:COSAG06_NODE_59432_length_274_cov_0.594286_1_plen_55_part_01
MVNIVPRLIISLLGGVRSRSTDNHFRDVAYVKNISTIEDCCAHCAAKCVCNAKSN